MGVDVPEATIMIIEDAERFGLAQLHQLRGRVGRGDKPSSCLLLYQGPLGETAKARLKIMRETEDGFVIAEEDLRPARQWRAAGHASKRHARLSAGGPVRARRLTGRRPATMAVMILQKDPELETERGPGAAHPALSLRARRGGEKAEVGVTLFSNERCGGHSLPSPKPALCRLPYSLSSSLQPLGIVPGESDRALPAATY